MRSRQYDEISGREEKKVNDDAPMGRKDMDVKECCSSESSSLDDDVVDVSDDAVVVVDVHNDDADDRGPNEKDDKDVADVAAAAVAAGKGRLTTDSFRRDNGGRIDAGAVTVAASDDEDDCHECVPNVNDGTNDDDDDEDDSIGALVLLSLLLCAKVPKENMRSWTSRQTNAHTTA